MQLWWRPLKPAELALMRGHQWNGRWDEWYEMEEMGWGWLCTGAQITIECVKDKLCLADKAISYYTYIAVWLQEMVFNNFGKLSEAVGENFVF